ncbi:MAG TPA: protein kinase [Candidatus Krumholzibacteria bacterium]
MAAPNEQSTTISDSPPRGGNTTTTGVLDRGLDTSAGVGFVRDRLALLGKMVFLLSFSFLTIMICSVSFLGGVPFPDVVRMPVAVGHFFASSMMGVIWLLARRTTSRAMLGAVDAFGVVMGCGFLALMTLHDPFQVQQAVAAISVTVMARAILVPSRPARTLVITTCAFVPTILVTIIHHHPTNFIPGNFSPAYQKLHLVLNTILWAILGITMATVTSRVMYGLRRQIAEVSELGQYILEEKIGGGGMGEVWRARHRLLIRPAAVKVIRRETLSAIGGDPQLLMRRFEREARATAALKSPHTVQLYDFGVAEDGTLYYVMELLDGFDLDTLVKRHGPLPAERAIHILRQVCSSLADAHGNGLVHRDIKPANVIISRAGTRFDFAKVLDFGLVKLDSAQRTDEPALKLTADGSTSGTPGFMAPEVVLGAAATDHRVDIYSLGCVAYWLLTGKLVFEGKTPMEVMIEHARTPAARPSLRVELPIPAPLEDIVMDCLEKEPDRRPESARAMSARLEAVPLPSAWSAERAEQWWATHRPQPRDARPVADILLSHEGRELKIAPRPHPHD